MIPWQKLATTTAPDGTELELRRRGDEWLIRAGGHELMSSEDAASSRSLAEIGCADMNAGDATKVLIGGLGMGFTLRAALDRVGKMATVEVAELVPAVVEWNQGPLGDLAGAPLSDPRTVVRVGDVRSFIAAATSTYDAILLDVDNGPIALAHQSNNGLYNRKGLQQAFAALRSGGALGVWSLADHHGFEERLEREGFDVTTRKVHGSRRGRGRNHVIWLGRKPVVEAGRARRSRSER